jgi:hypothetical protein
MIRVATSGPDSGFLANFSVIMTNVNINKPRQSRRALDRCIYNELESLPTVNVCYDQEPTVLSFIGSFPWKKMRVKTKMH